MTRLLDDGARVAVIGSGVSGLVAAHVLGHRHPVTLFEADDRLGGHADTHQVRVGDLVVPVDTGFIVHNDRTYPTLLRVFDELGIATQDTDMSMSVRIEATGIEYAGARGLSGVFAQRRNLMRSSHLGLLWDIGRFHRAARALLTAPAGRSGADEPLSDFLDRTGLGPHFRSHFMTPLVAAVWSCDPGRALDYPARHLFTFLEHHGMLGVFGSPTWRTVTGGSRRYVEAVAAGVADVRLASPVGSVRERPEGVLVSSRHGAEVFDAVVVATHPHQALRLLAEATATQTELLGAISYTPNTAVLHTDESLLPRARAARASWNYLAGAAADPSGPAGRSGADGAGGPSSSVVVSYDMTRLQRITAVTDRRFIVTLGGEHLIDPTLVIDRTTYEHPLFTPSSLAAIGRLPELSTDRVAFAGAYHGWGFHEDGALSGLRAAERLGATWRPASPSDRLTTAVTP